MTYYSATRVSDGFMMIDDFTQGTDQVRVIHAGIKRRVDEAIRTEGESESVEPEQWYSDRGVIAAAEEAFGCVDAPAEVDNGRYLG